MSPAGAQLGNCRETHARIHRSRHTRGARRPPGRRRPARPSEYRPESRRGRSPQCPVPVVPSRRRVRRTEWAGGPLRTRGRTAGVEALPRHRSAVVDGLDGVAIATPSAQHLLHRLVEHLPVLDREVTTTEKWWKARVQVLTTVKRVRCRGGAAVAREPLGRARPTLRRGCRYR